MKILAFDSTAKTASVAVADDEQILAEFTVDSGMTQSELLLPMAKQALAAAHLHLHDIELFALTTGPGSFTGVRIGAALVKGLAFGKGIPCAPVSVMEALAESLLPLDGIYCPVTDARREHVYQAFFCKKDNSLLRLCEDRLMAIPALIEELDTQYHDTTIRLAGDATETVLQAGKTRGLLFPPTPPSLRVPRASAVARCGLAMAKRGQVVDDISLAPTYLFPSQAERERLEKEQENRNTKEI